MMIFCKKFAAHSSDYIDGRVSWYGRFAMWMHALMCVKCRRYIAQLRGVVHCCAALGCEDEAKSESIDAVALDRLTDAFLEAPKGAG